MNHVSFDWQEENESPLLCSISGSGGSSSSKQQAGPTPAEQKQYDYTTSQTNPVLDQISQLFQKVMSTGTAAGPQIPILQRSIEGAKKAQSDTQRTTDANIAGANITGPYARSVSEGVREQGGFDISQIVPNFLMQWLQGAPNFGLGQGSPVLSSSQQTSHGKSSSTQAGASIFGFGSK